MNREEAYAALREAHAAEAQRRADEIDPGADLRDIWPVRTAPPREVESVRTTLGFSPDVMAAVHAAENDPTRNLNDGAHRCSVYGFEWDGVVLLMRAPVHPLVLRWEETSLPGLRVLVGALSMTIAIATLSRDDAADASG